MLQHKLHPANPKQQQLKQSIPTEVPYTLHTTGVHQPSARKVDRRKRVHPPECNTSPKTHPATPFDNFARFIGLLFLARELLRTEVSHRLPYLLVVALPRRCPRPLFPLGVSVGAVRGITGYLLGLGTLCLRSWAGALVACEPTATGTTA